MDCSGARLLLLLLTETLLCETGGYLLLSKLSDLLLTCPDTVSDNKKVTVISIWIRISDFFMARVLLDAAGKSLKLSFYCNTQ